MFLSSLTLKNYRSYTQAEFNFSGKTSVIVGENTAGKTNILEAIYLLAIGKSFRVEKESEAINWAADFTNVKGLVIDEDPIYNEKIKKELEVVIVDQVKLGQGENKLQKITKGKKYLVNDVSKRQADFLGHLYAVLFSPFDLDLVSGSPSLRRKYLDLVLIQTDKTYRRSLSLYEKGVRQRNKLLLRIRDEGVPAGQLYFWNDLLLKNGKYITDQRRIFINFLNAQPEAKFNINYDHSEITEERLQFYAKQEILAATTLIGPHRDDFQILLEKDQPEKQTLDINLYASRGEQRMGVLWLKIGEFEFIKEKTGKIPLLLLDDIFSELDENHRAEVVKTVSLGQTIITTTDLARLDKKVIEKMQVIELGI